MEPLKDANKLKSKLPVKRGIPTPLGKCQILIQELFTLFY